MLKISEMAKLANTTRRTLIFYDQKNIFKPKYKTDTGYRYYEYDQLYDLLFILGLRDLNLSLKEIERVKKQSKKSQTSYLINAQSKVSKRISELVRIQQILDKRIEEETIFDNSILYKPMIKQRTQIKFWYSRYSANRTEEGIAELYSEFYKQLDSLVSIDTTKSGFLTNLSIDNPEGYDKASFRIIKETINVQHKTLLPFIQKDAGNYICILVENTKAGVHRGLIQLKEYCHQQQLEVENYLWQINFGNSITKSGASKYVWLDFTIINSSLRENLIYGDD